MSDAHILHQLTSVKTGRQRAIQVAMQLGVLSILTLITVAAFTHIATMLIFRRLIVGKSKRRPDEAADRQRERAAARHPFGGYEDNGSWSEEFYVPVISTLTNAAIFEDDEVNESTSMVRRGGERALGAFRAAWSTTIGLPSSIRRGLLRGPGVSNEIYVRCYHHRRPADGSRGTGNMMILCNPSGETVDSLSGKAVSLSEASGFDSLTLFDYRSTGKSCKGIVAPDTATMLEDAESVMRWLITVKDVDPTSITISGISIGGLQAIRLAVNHPASRGLLLINTFSSFSCLLGRAAPLLPGALRLGATSAFLPDITSEMRQISTPEVAVISVEEDERIPTRCTYEMVNALRETPGVERVIHIVMQGSHSQPIVDHGSLEVLREFLGFREPHAAYDSTAGDIGLVATIPSFDVEASFF